MTDAVSTAAAASVAGVVAARPPEEVIWWALIGALVAIWLDGKGDHSLDRKEIAKWAINAAGMILVSAASGIALSALVQSIAANVSFLSPLAHTPRWVTAAIIAALIHKIGPILFSVFKSKASKEASK